MSYGLELGGEYGKLFLTLFRICVVIWGVFMCINQLNLLNFHQGLLICFGLIIGGVRKYSG